MEVAASVSHHGLFLIDVPRMSGYLFRLQLTDRDANIRSNICNVPNNGY